MSEAPDKLPDELINKYAASLDNNVAKAFRGFENFITNNSGKIYGAIFIGHCIGLYATNRSFISGYEQSAFMLAMAQLFLWKVPAAITATGFVGKFAGSLFKPDELARPLEHWDKSKPVSFFYSEKINKKTNEVIPNKDRGYIYAPGIDSPIKIKEMDAFSLPELTEIVGNIRDRLNPNQTNTLRDMISETRHAGNVDTLAPPALSAEVIDSFNKLSNKEKNIYQELLNAGSIKFNNTDFNKFISKIALEEGREIKSLTVADRPAHGSPQLSM